MRDRGFHWRSKAITDKSGLSEFLKATVPRREYLLGFFFPRICPVCGKAAAIGEYIHGKCIKKLPLIMRKLDMPEKKQCPSFSDVPGASRSVAPQSFDEGLAVFAYDEVMRAALAALKYRHRKEYGETFGKLMYFYGRPVLERWRPDMIVPVPVHKKRLRQRGFNQAEVIAGELSRLTGIPAEPRTLLRISNTAALKELSPEERKEELKGAFVSGGMDLGGRKVLLVEITRITWILTERHMFQGFSDTLRRISLYQNGPLPPRSYLRPGVP